MTSSVSFTSRLLNYTEPYFIDGVAKTSFYTEVNTNIKKNDKVFITNGYYDSERYISKGKWVKNADGYRVLFVDRCKIVLDINYNQGYYIGLTQTYVEENFDNYIKVYHIRTQREFDYINKIFIDSYTQSRVSKFEKNLTNNIIYSDQIFNGVLTGIGANNGLGTTKAFWARQGNNWVNVSNQFSLNSFTFSQDYYTAGLSNNGRMVIVGEDINYGGKIFKEKNIYKFFGSTNDWRIDTEYKKPFISKLNFKAGIFKGVHNDGIFGSYKKTENWYGNQSTWNSGFFVNSNWYGGVMESKSSQSDQSFYCTIENGVPVQTTDFSNNKANGYNYILDSNIYAGIIENGNFINCNVGSKSYGLTAIDDYFTPNMNNYDISLEGGLYNYCDINNTKIKNSFTLDSIVENSYLKNVRTLNTQLSDSYSEGGEFSINNGITVLTADLCSYIPSNLSMTQSNIRGILKLYISEKDYERLDTFDNFFITKINKEYILSSLNSDQRILLPYETRYVLDTFWDFKVNGTNQECIGSIKTKNDNLNIPLVRSISGNLTNSNQSNSIRYASLDIDLGYYMAFYETNNQYNYINQSVITKNNVSNLFLNTSISNSDFRNGVIKGINWTSGSNINYPSNIIKYESNKLKITKSGNDILVYLNETKPTIDDNQLRVGTYVWLDSIFHTDDIGSITDISGEYKIKSYSSDEIILANSRVVGLTGGTYSVLNTMPNYVSIHKLLIEDSSINSGLFNRTLFKSSVFYNDTFNNKDKSISNSNIDKLRLVGQIFKSNINTIKSGLIHKSHIMDIIWENGISNNNIWMGSTFSNGVFNDGYWVNGVFQNGIFQNSKDTSLSSLDFSFLQYYKNWFNGTFNDGEFYNSVWLNGVFNNGKFYNSDWYGGIWNNGILGDKNLPTLNTSMSRYLNLGVGATQTFWYNGIVENAQIGGDGIVYWLNGEFNNGVFTSYGTDTNKESIWYDGNFDGGNFTDLARWKNGNFNKGKFTSYYGWTNSGSTYSNDYSWEYGQFNGGQFGNGQYATNSTWFNGEFNGGIFQGRVWNNGIFQNGNFNGGSTYSSILQEESFVNSFTNSYYGLWRNGWVTNIKHRAITDREIGTSNLRFNQEDTQKFAILDNILWVNGIFDHQNGEISNSTWLNGKFKSGTFKNGSFNPYVRRNWFDQSFGTYSTFNLSVINCLWENGNFDGGNFYISDWYNGNFLSGTMSGARWLNGTWYFGSAKNIYWDNGTWENGLWDGTPFDYNDLDGNNRMTPGKNRDLLLRVSNIHENGKIHLINAFTGSITSDLLVDGDFSQVNRFDGWTFSDTSSSLADWVPGTSGLTLPTYLYSNPELTEQPWVGFGYSQFLVGSNVYQNDEYSVYISGIGPLGYVTGYISVTASSIDTDNTIAQKLSDVINQGNTSPIVKRYRSSNTTWYDLFQDYINSSYILNSLSVNYNSEEIKSVYTQTKPVIISGYSESETLYALATGTTFSVFTQSQVEYSINLTVSNNGGRTDFVVYTGNISNSETITGNITKSYNYKYIPTEENDRFGIKRVLYPNPDNTSSFSVIGASVNISEAAYDDQYNNKLYDFITFTTPLEYGLTGSTVSVPSQLLKYTPVKGNLVSLKFGNGSFKSGIWKGGYWNNGWRSVWNTDELDYVIFSDIYDNYFIQDSQNSWKVKLRSLSGIGDLKSGDRVSIGNIICIDVNENRILIKDFFRIIDVGSDYIVVKIDLNVPVRRIIKDSDDHMIYVTKNIWLSGVFHNGYFKGVWNYGKFKGYPYITKMEDTHWIDGIFDGGRFKSDKSYYQLGGQTFSYNTGVIQNFVFRDNNIRTNLNEFTYNSWIDSNYLTYSMVNLYKDNRRYDNNYGVIISSNNLRGYPVTDVLSSESIFQNSFDLNSKYYKLGTKYKVYNDFIGDSSYFGYPLNTSGEPGITEFAENGWEYSTTSVKYRSNTDESLDDEGVLEVSYNQVLVEKFGAKLTATFSMTYLNNNNNIGMGNQPISNSGYTVYQNYLMGTQTPLGASMSYLSYDQTSWNSRFSGINSLSFNVNNVNFDVNGSLFPTRDIGNTIDNNRRSYVINSVYFDFLSTNISDDGYLNYGTFSNPLISLTDNTEKPFTYNAYKVQKDSKFVINLSLPFSFYASEEYRNNLGNDRRGGYSMFRFVGVVEKCANGSSTSVDSNWKYVCNTKLKLSKSESYYYKYGIDRNTCTIAFDDVPPVFYGELLIDNFNVELSEGDHIRIRLYFQTLRKMWASSGGPTSHAPGDMILTIGTGNTPESFNYTQNNSGFFEIVDVDTYVVNKNILNNVYSKDIEKSRYSVVDFDLDGFSGETRSSDGQPVIYLLNDAPDNRPNSDFTELINHAETGIPGNKKEYFYNRDSLQLFFKASQDFTARFSKISFLETDMIPFFVYATESNINNSIQVPLSGTSSTVVGAFKLD